MFKKIRQMIAKRQSVVFFILSKQRSGRKMFQSTQFFAEYYLMKRCFVKNVPSYVKL